MFDPWCGRWCGCGRVIVAAAVAVAVAVGVASAAVVVVRDPGRGGGGRDGAVGVVCSLVLGPWCCARGLSWAAGVGAVMLGPGRRGRGRRLADGAVGVASLPVIPGRGRWSGVLVLDGARLGGAEFFVAHCAAGAGFAAVG